MSRSESVERAAESRPRSAIQLHTLRNIDEPLPETIRRVADAGYEGVEFAGRFLEADSRAVRDALDETGVEPVAAHADLSALEGDLESVADRCRRVGCDHVVIPHLGAGYFRTTTHVDRLARRLDGLAGRADSRGLRLSYHTSKDPFLPLLDRFGLGVPANLPSPGLVWELVAEAADLTVRGADRTAETTGLGRLASRTDDLGFEVDVGWVTAGGYDPVDVFELLGDRLSLIHIADVERRRRFPPAFRSVPPGEGMLDLDRVLRASRETGVDWLVFEDDHPSDPEAAVYRGRATLARSD
ncbi:sugar phosphate isomerase/epimerase family protein [Halorubrum lipolyticum]|uniref:Sugar phosphate isomerase/epimerase n=1 Tax=Halorubrum lipolyticum DSM 21995 TaxID=1227482 RepID=M0NN18_9EURY|nr:sugar phosphate isomerase/epimerase [Halorubrum lipolyticum]EMA59347.1 sugar phosphate isomerase/epimerase [Halorubrum lipolyticum DSM 21995]